MSIVLQFLIWFIITVYCKRRQILLQIATAILLQSVTEVYYKMHQIFHYKMQQLFQIATNLLQNATVITKGEVYYKLYNCIFYCYQHSYSKSALTSKPRLYAEKNGQRFQVLFDY